MAPKRWRCRMSRRPVLTAVDKAEVWMRRSHGEPVWMIARHIGRKRDTVHRYVRATGGVQPRLPQRSRRELTAREREELSRPGRRRLLSGHGQEDGPGIFIGVAGSPSERGPRTVSGS